MAPSTLWVVVPLAGFALALAFGAIAHRTGFCTMGAVTDVALFGDWRRMRMWVLAIATALAGTQALHLLGVVDLGLAFYTAPRLLWLSHIVGGLIFGVGMTLASGCGNRNLVRLGGGNLKSAVVLLMLGLSAYATMKGILAVPRVQWLDAAGVTLEHRQDLPGFVGESWRSWIAAALSAALALWCLSDRDFRATRGYVAGGVVIGALVVAGWYVTGHVGFLEEDPDTLESLVIGTNSARPESFTFVAPVAYTLELLMLWTDASLHPTFAVALLFGTIAGAFAHARLAGEFRWEFFASAADFRNHAAGGLMMGFGGVTAIGCTVGQGISGVSTLALGSFLTVGAIVAGCALTVFALYASSNAPAVVDTPGAGP